MLYLVATPIGNLKDISVRAIETLKSVDEIGCEDTRHSLVLLNAYDIRKPLFSYHKFNEKEECVKIVEKLKQGKNIAIISDAGMPCISDPGNVLVKTLIENNLEYTLIAGSNAGLSALVLSGLDTTSFAFIGFLPEKKTDRVNLIENYKNLPCPLIIYSAPHDVNKDIKSLYEVLGDRNAVAVKEITKIHERVIPFNLKDGIEESLVKGEFVIVVDKAPKEDFSSLSEEEHIKMYINSGMSKKDALKTVAKIRGVSKSSLYKYTLEK